MPGRQTSAEECINHCDPGHVTIDGNPVKEVLNTPNCFVSACAPPEIVGPSFVTKLPVSIHVEPGPSTVSWEWFPVAPAVVSVPPFFTFTTPRFAPDPSVNVLVVWVQLAPGPSTVSVPCDPIPNCASAD